MIRFTFFRLLHLAALMFMQATAGLALAQNESEWRVADVSGEVNIRSAHALTWSKLAPGQSLHSRATLRTGARASLRLQNTQGKFFTLPGQAQIETEELKQLTREEVVLALTALELQRLPARKDSAKTKSGAFILHGAVPAETHAATITREYVQQEVSGALALYEQGYLGGFIVKWHRLLSIFPEAASEAAEAALIQAYTTLDMPLRAQQARVRFKQRWPKSATPE